MYNMILKKRLYTARAELKRKKEAWKKAIRSKWDNKCMKCLKSGEEYKLDCHHISYRKDIKWDSRQGLLLCKSCHKFSHISAHKSGFEFYYWLFKTHPTLCSDMINLIDSLNTS